MPWAGHELAKKELTAGLVLVVKTEDTVVHLQDGDTVAPVKGNCARQVLAENNIITET